MLPLSSFAAAIVLAVSSFAVAQTAPAQSPPPPQTARQALIEMFFGDAPGHFEKHLPDITRQAMEKFAVAKGQSGPEVFDFLSMIGKNGKEKPETFDTGPVLLKATIPVGGTLDKNEITVERDDLLGDEDQIELALHITNDGREETFFPRFFALTFQ